MKKKLFAIFTVALMTLGMSSFAYAENTGIYDNHSDHAHEAVLDVDFEAPEEYTLIIDQD